MKFGNDWVAVVPGSPGEMGSKFCCGEEVGTSKVPGCSISDEGYTHNDEDALSQEDEAASGERGSDRRCLPRASQSNKVCERESINICNGAASGSVTEEKIGETHMQVQDQAGEFISKEVPPKDHGSNGDAWEVYRSSVSRIVELLSDKFWDVEDGDDNILSLEDSLLKERTENEKMRAEIAVTKDKLNFFLDLAEKGSRRKCTYCWSVKENLSTILKPVIQRSDASAGSVEVLTGTEFNSTCTSDIEVAQRSRSPVGSCTYEILNEDKGNANHDESSLKRKRNFKQQSICGEGKESTLFFNCTSLTECDIVPNTGGDVDVKSCPEYAHCASPNTQKSKISKCLDIGKCGSEELLETVKGDKKQLPYKMGSQLEEEAFRLDSIKAADAIIKYGFNSVNACDDKDMVIVNSHDEGQRFLEELYEDLKRLTGNISEVNFIDLKCGCKSQAHGDTVGILRVLKTGLLEIQCQCSAICEQGMNVEGEKQQLPEVSTLEAFLNWVYIRSANQKCCAIHVVELKLRNIRMQQPHRFITTYFIGLLNQALTKATEILFKNISLGKLFCNSRGR
eukprot:c26258_g1_i2 orf=322-2019(-)